MAMPALPKVLLMVPEFVTMVLPSNATRIAVSPVRSRARSPS